MAMTPRLEMRQGQSLVMTPQLQQAIKLLQLSNVELAEFIETELERNPLLERQETESDTAPEPTDASAVLELSNDFPSAAANDAVDADMESLNPDLSRNDLADAGASMTDWSRSASGNAFDELPDLEETLANTRTLSDHLEDQLSEAGVTPGQRLIGRALIDGLDDWGYWRGDVDALAAQLGTAPAAVSDVLQIMKGFEPTGVMARDLAECLSLQLIELNRFDPAMQMLIANLDVLAKRQMDKLMALCGVDAEDMRDMIAEVRALTPKPGAGYGASASQTVTPDVYVRGLPDGSWHVELNADSLPKVLVNNRYVADVSSKAKREEDKQFISNCASNANWLVKSLDQRARTILKVAREIVRQQDGFLAYGVEFLRPLNLKTIASAIDMHESTVSRVTTNKFVATPRGVFELKYFFTAAIASADGGDAHSAEAVRRKIQKLIADEKPESILSDDRIVEILKGVGIDIARRTVAKYRESLRIPSSVERKRIAGMVR